MGESGKIFMTSSGREGVIFGVKVTPFSRIEKKYDRFCYKSDLMQVPPVNCI